MYYVFVRRRTLLLMMVRAEHPVQFTAGKFLKLSRSTLVQVETTLDILKCLII